MTYFVTAESNSAELVALIPWVAKVGPKSGIMCQGHTGYTPRTGQRKPCKRESTFFYSMLDKTWRWYCRTHLDDNILGAIHGPEESEYVRCQKWFDKNVKVLGG